MSDKVKKSYQQALRASKQRMTSECPHKYVKNGRCIRCQRKVMTLSDIQNDPGGAL